MTVYIPMTSRQFLALSRPEQLVYCRRIAENYRDEVVVPRGCCGFIWRVPDPAVGSIVCEEPLGHRGDHRSGDATARVALEGEAT